MSYATKYTFVYYVNNTVISYWFCPSEVRLKILISFMEFVCIMSIYIVHFYAFKRDNSTPVCDNNTALLPQEWFMTEVHFLDLAISCSFTSVTNHLSKYSVTYLLNKVNYLQQIRSWILQRTRQTILIVTIFKNIVINIRYLSLLAMKAMKIEL